MAQPNKCDLPNVDGIHIVSLIGKGHFSRVFKGILLKDSETVAVKVIDKSDLNKGKVNVIISEIGIMKSLNHPHIVRLRDFKWDSKSVYIILEYCEGGSLYEYIKLKNRLKEKVCKRALRQLASGLAYLRSKNICHMDLKPLNILMKFNPFTIKIADFGLAQYIPEKNFKDNLRGSPLYMAPEILLTDKYDSKVDLWSVGIILYECLYGRAPLAHKNLQELIDSLKNEAPIKFYSTVTLSKDCKDLLEKLLVYNPNRRISYDDFFNHPFIDLVHAPSEENKKLALQIIYEAVKSDEDKNYVKAFNSYCRALRYLIPLLETMTASEERAYYQLKISEYLIRAEELKSLLFKDTKSKTSKSKLLTSEDLGDVREVDRLVTRGDRDVSSLISSDSPRSSSVSDECALNNASNSFDKDSIKIRSKANANSVDEASATTSNKNDEGSSQTSKESLNFNDVGKTFPNDIFCSQSIKECFKNCPKIHGALDIGFSGQMYMIQGDYDVAYSKYETALSMLITEVREFPPGVQRDLLLILIKRWLSEAEGAKTLASAKSINLSENLKNSTEVMDSNCSIQ